MSNGGQRAAYDLLLDCAPIALARTTIVEREVDTRGRSMLLTGCQMRVHLFIVPHDKGLRATVTETSHGMVQFSRTRFVNNRKQADAIAKARAKRHCLSTYDVEDQTFSRARG